MDAEVGRFDRVTGHAFDTSGQLVAFAVVLEVAYEVAIRTAFYALEVVPASQVSYERWHVHCTKFIFRYGESHDGAVVRSEALVGEFLIERNIGVTIDGGENTSVTGSGKLFDLGNDGLVVLVVERSVFLDDVFVGYTFALQESLENFIGRTWENIVRTQKVELFRFQFVHHVLGSWNQLLIRGSGRVEDVQGLLFTFVLHWVEEEGVVFLDYGQYGFTADGGPAAEDGRNFVFEDQILGFFSKEGPIGSRVDDHWFDLMAENSTFLVNLVDGHAYDVFERGFGDRHCATEGVEDTDLDGLLCLQSSGTNSEES